VKKNLLDLTDILLAPSEASFPDLPRSTGQPTLNHTRHVKGNIFGLDQERSISPAKTKGRTCTPCTHYGSAFELFSDSERASRGPIPGGGGWNLR